MDTLTVVVVVAVVVVVVVAGVEEEEAWLEVSVFGALCLSANSLSWSGEVEWSG